MCCCKRFCLFLNHICTAMSLDENRQSQRPYRYGMVLLCIGALINWLGLAENYVEPVRYIGVACIIAGALLICAAMCCWLQAPPPRPQPSTHQIDDPIHIINVSADDEVMQQKPPDYDSVAGAPPTYDDAIKLSPNQLPAVHYADEASRRRSSTHQGLSTAAINSLMSCPSGSREVIPGQLETGDVGVVEEAQIPKTPPPPYQQVKNHR